MSTTISQKATATMKTSTLSVGDVDRLLIDRLKAALRDRDLDITGDIHAMRRRLRKFIEAASAPSPLQPAATNTPSKSSKPKGGRPLTTKKKVGLRKRSANDDDENAGVNVAALSDAAFEALLRKHETEAESKRRRTEQYEYVPNADGTLGPGGQLTAAALDQLPGPCITLVFEMLPRCRDIFHLAFLSKHLLSHVERRTDLIIRTAVHENAHLHGREAAGAESSGVVGRRWGGVSRRRDASHRIVSQIAEDVRSRALHVPSSLRLLRLLCAQRCEKGEDCWGYHLEKETVSSWRSLYSYCIVILCTTIILTSCNNYIFCTCILLSDTGQQRPRNGTERSPSLRLRNLLQVRRQLLPHHPKNVAALVQGGGEGPHPGRGEASVPSNRRCRPHDGVRWGEGRTDLVGPQRTPGHHVVQGRG